MNMMLNIFRYEEIIAYVLALFSIIYIVQFVIKRRKCYFSLTTLDITIGLYCIYSVANIWITEGARIEPANICKWTTVIILYILVRCFENKNLILLVLVLSGIGESIIAICQKLGWLESQHTKFDVTGHLGNPGPLGGYLSICLIICFYFLWKAWQSKRQWSITITIVSCVIIMIGVVLSDSRAAVLGLLLGGFYFFFIYNIVIIKRHWFKFVCIGCFIFSVCAILIYQYRPLSANARLLIWRVSTEMLVDKPLIGHGIGSFSWRYMLYQARYFEEKKEISEIMVAENVAYPYNELLHLAIEIGIIGLLFACLIIAVIYYHSSLDIFQLFIKTGFTVWLIFSTFSYSTEILPLLFLLPLLLGCIGSKQLFTYTIHLGVKCVIIVLCLAICVSAVRIGLIYHDFSAKLAMLPTEENKNVVSLIDKYHPMLKNNIKFNIIYSKWLTKQTLHSRQRMDQIEAIIPTCENYCLLGDYYREMKRFAEAEESYIVASNMIPTRLRPNYKLWSLYLQIGSTVKAVTVARHIQQQPLKVENSFTINAKSEVKRYLKNN